MEQVHDAGLVPRSVPLDTLRKALEAGSRVSLAEVDQAVQELGRSAKVQARPDRKMFVEARKKSMVMKAQAAGAAAFLRRSGVDAKNAVRLSGRLFEILAKGIVLVRIDYGDDLRIAGPVLFDKTVHQVKARDITIAPGAVLQFASSHFSIICRSLMRK